MRGTITQSDPWWNGLEVKTYWSGDEAVQEWIPGPGQPGIQDRVDDDGILAQVIDAQCAFVAATPALEGGRRCVEPLGRFAIASTNMLSWRPAAADQPLTIRARIDEIRPTEIVMACVLSVNGIEHIRLRVTVVRPAQDAAA
jgi:hypothetical protein